MIPRRIKWSNAAPFVMAASVVGMVVFANWRDARGGRLPPAPAVGTPGGMRTSRASLDQGIAMLDTRLAADPLDDAAAAKLAAALLRKARVTSDGALAVRAERVLTAVLSGRGVWQPRESGERGFPGPPRAGGHGGEAPGSRDAPLDYEARRMLGAVYLAQHRFHEAIAAAERARQMEPTDPWNYGVLGDGYLEIGDYERAFDAFDTMVTMRPSAAAYARVAYAHELQGNLDRALEVMKMAAEATTSHDPEAQAWHYAQIGNLHVAKGDLTAARREYERAGVTFPGHPYAMAGLARIKAASGELRAALESYREILKQAETPELAAVVGDLHARLGDVGEAERHYELAERLEREGWKVEAPQPGALARFLAERGRKTNEALELARRAASERRDIFTEDALAWAAFKTDRLDEALDASNRALRTGTRDRRILYHAAAIRHAVGRTAEARVLLERALKGHQSFDVIAAPEAVELMARLGTTKPTMKATKLTRPTLTTKVTKVTKIEG